MSEINMRELRRRQPYSTLDIDDQEACLTREFFELADGTVLYVGKELAHLILERLRREGWVTHDDLSAAGLQATEMPDMANAKPRKKWLEGSWEDVGDWDVSILQSPQYRKEQEMRTKLVEVALKAVTKEGHADKG